MKRILCFLAFGLILFACNKNDNNDNSGEDNRLAGRYRGTFSRSGMDTVDVSFFFRENNTYEGTGGPMNYPAICNGTFQRNGNDLAVNDLCPWTANFDWTLIFDGNYTIDFTGENKVRIWRASGAVIDEYRLNRIVR